MPTEDKAGVEALYSLPKALAEMPLQGMHPLDPRFRLEQIATKVEDAFFAIRRVIPREIK